MYSEKIRLQNVERLASVKTTLLFKLKEQSMESKREGWFEMARRLFLQEDWKGVAIETSMADVENYISVVDREGMEDAVEALIIPGVETQNALDAYDGELVAGAAHCYKKLALMNYPPSLEKELFVVNFALFFEDCVRQGRVVDVVAHSLGGSMFLRYVIFAIERAVRDRDTGLLCDLNRATRGIVLASSPIHRDDLRLWVKGPLGFVVFEYFQSRFLGIDRALAKFLIGAWTGKRGEELAQLFSRYGFMQRVISLRDWLTEFGRDSYGKALEEAGFRGIDPSVLARLGIEEMRLKFVEFLAGKLFYIYSSGDMVVNSGVLERLGAWGNGFNIMLFSREETCLPAHEIVRLEQFWEETLALCQTARLDYFEKQAQPRLLPWYIRSREVMRRAMVRG